MDKKKPDCSEPPYFSCFQITLYFTCKDNIYRTNRKDTLGKTSQIGNWLIYVDRYGK